jgi:hypothetical protein
LYILVFAVPLARAPSTLRRFAGRVRPRLPRLGLAFAAAGLASCAGGEPFSSAPTIASIRVEPSTSWAGSIGQTVAFSATANGMHWFGEMARGPL